MDIDPMEYVEGDDGDEKERKAQDRARSRLNTLVAVTVALIATFMGICNVKDGNIVQVMQQNQADKIDNWNFYQARNIREAVYQSTADQLRTIAAAATPATRAVYAREAAAYDKRAAEQAEKKREPMAAAQKADKDYTAWNVHDDQFDLAEAMLSIAIALLATTALTQKRWLYVVALVPMSMGFVYGLAGLFEWGLHSNLAARFLGT